MTREDQIIIEAEIERHDREYRKTQERYGWSVSNSGEKTMRKHDVLSEALASYLRSAKKRQAARTKLSDVHDLVCANLKRIEEGWNDQNIKAILQHIKAILEREE